MSFKTVSAILRGQWLLDKTWAQSHLPVLVSILNGESSFAGLFEPGYESKKEDAEPLKVLSRNAAGSVYTVGYYTDLSRLPNDAIAMVNITGPVTKYGDMCAYGSIDHEATMNRLANAPNVKGIILNIDSPGGEAAGTALLADAIKSASRQKPVIAMINDGIAASAAMWIASSANEIYTTQKTDMVGSVGVYTTIADWYGYMESQGLKVRDIYAPQSTEKNLDYREAIAGNDDPLKAELKVLAQEFIDTVARNRAGKIKGDAWKTGKMFYSKEAASIGLTDGQKTFTQIVRRMDTLISQKQQTNNNTMATNQYEKIKALAPEGEEFVNEAVDGAVWVTESHLANIEVALKNNDAIRWQMQQQINDADAAKTQAENELAGAKQTIAAKDGEIEQLNAQIAELKNKPAADFTQTQKAKDELGGGAVVEESEATKEAKRLRAKMGLPNNF